MSFKKYEQQYLLELCFMSSENIMLENLAGI